MKRCLKRAARAILRPAMPTRRKRAPYTGGKKPDPLAAPSGVFLPDKEMMVRLIAMKGATDAEIEDIFLCPRGTLTKWKEMYPSFAKAIDTGRSAADADVLYALYKTAIGYDYTEEQAVGGKIPSVLTVKRHRPAEFAAQKYWIGNRTGWHSVERSEHTGAGGGPIGVKPESRNEIIDSILNLVQSKPDVEQAQAKDQRK